jgi:hypothetical protein
VDAALAEAVDENNPAKAEMVANTLSELARRLLPAQPGTSRRRLLASITVFIIHSRRDRSNQGD